MRFVHVSDLHIGKQLHGYSLIEDQKKILAQILDVTRDEQADGLLVAGDLYDRAVPSEEAVAVCDRFVTEAAAICPVYLIAGNHDSAERLAFGRKLMQKNDVYFAGAYGGKAEKIVLEDGDGPLNLWLLPYIKTSTVRQFYGDKDIDTPDKAMERTLRASGIDPGARNVLVVHQFVTGTDIELCLSDSEDCRPEVGGADCISAGLLKDFDYVALGHLHRPQSAGRPEVRYSGSPLVYSESEAEDRKSVTVVDLGPKGKVDIRTVPLVPDRPLRVIRGTLEELLAAAHETEVSPDDYIAARLTDNPPEARPRLLAVYPHLLDVIYLEEKGMDPSADPGRNLEELRRMDPGEVFAEFYAAVNGKDMTDRQREEFRAALERAKENAKQGAGQ